VGLPAPSANPEPTRLFWRPVRARIPATLAFSAPRSIHRMRPPQGGAMLRNIAPGASQKV